MATDIVVSYSELDTARQCPDVQWLAGLLEGEGCFIWYKQNGARYPRIQVTMTDLDVVQRVADILGGNSVQAHAPDQFKRKYVTKITGTRAVEWMRILRPLMGQRRGSRIDEILQEADCGN